MALLPIAILSAQQQSVRSRYELEGQHAIQINDLAGRIDSLEDAQKLVNTVADEFADELPPKWMTRSLRNRIAKAEYQSAAGPETLIHEQQVADSWNDYLEKVGAPPEYYVTAAEVHTLRDSEYASARWSWTLGNQNVWSVPNIYAVGPDGKVANGCRAIEAIRVLWDLASQPNSSVLGTRGIMKKGVLLSDTFKGLEKPPAPGPMRVSISMSMSGPGVSMTNPVEEAERQYVRERGVGALNRAIHESFDGLFPK
jgi:hypothetical protein